MLSRTLFCAATLAVATTSLGCSGAKAPGREMRPLEERRARAIIEEAVADGGMQPSQGRIVKVVDGEVTEDIRVGDTSYGIVYLTANELNKAGTHVRTFNEEAPLQVVKAAGGKAILVILHEQAYRYDAGDTHAATVVTAEKKLRRDVSDFVLQYAKQGKGR